MIIYVKNDKIIILLMRNNLKLLVFATEILYVLYAMYFISKLEPILCLDVLCSCFNLCLVVCLFLFLMPSL